MILMIDNYDSFTYNLVQYFGELGARLEVRRNDDIDLHGIRGINPEGIVISPGPGRPEAAGISVPAVQEMASFVPVLGVCLGHQAIACAFGGAVVSAPVLMHGKTSVISHDRSHLFHDISNPFTATRYHSLMVDRKTLPSDLTVTAETADGVIMAMQHSRFPCYGVQFHPESILTLEGKLLLKNFLSICRRRKEGTLNEPE